MTCSKGAQEISFGSIAISSIGLAGCTHVSESLRAKCITCRKGVQESLSASIAASSSGLTGSTQSSASLRVPDDTFHKGAQEISSNDITAQFNKRGLVDVLPFGAGNGEFHYISSVGDSDGDGDPIHLAVRCRDVDVRALVEHDLVAGRSGRLARQYFRDRPTLPPGGPSA